MTPKKFKVGICGEDFPFGRTCMEKVLDNLGEEAVDIELKVLKKENLARELKDGEFDVALPFQSRLGGNEMQSPKLKAIIQYGVGLEGVDIPEASKRGILVSNIPANLSPNAEATAEHAIYLMLSANRNPELAKDYFHKGVLGAPLTTQTYKKRALILGFGNIGKAILKRLGPFSLEKITVVKRSPLSEAESRSYMDYCEQFGTKFECITLDVSSLRGTSGSLGKDIVHDIQNANFIFLSCVATASTQGMFSANFVKILSQKEDKNRFLAIINIARGSLVSSTSMLEALDNDLVSFYASDVGAIPLNTDSAIREDALEKHPEPFDPDQELAKHPHTLFTPHNGGIADASYVGMSDGMARKLLDLKNTGSIEGCVNLAEINMLGTIG